MVFARIVMLAALLGLVHHLWGQEQARRAYLELYREHPERSIHRNAEVRGVNLLISFVYEPQQVEGLKIWVAQPMLANSWRLVVGVKSLHTLREIELAGAAAPSSEWIKTHLIKEETPVEAKREEGLARLF